MPSTHIGLIVISLTLYVYRFIVIHTVDSYSAGLTKIRLVIHL